MYNEFLFGGSLLLWALAAVWLGPASQGASPLLPYSADFRIWNGVSTNRPIGFWIDEPICKAGSVKPAELITITNAPDEPHLKLSIVAFANHFRPHVDSDRTLSHSSPPWEQHLPHVS